MIPALLERCAGIDVGKKFVVVCLMLGPLTQEPQKECRRFGASVPELEQLAQWLGQHQVTHVVMESTGVYWIPLFNLLEEQCTVILANPVDVKVRKGHKTDRKDAEHLAHLLRHGQVRASFIPPREIRDLRDLTRRRQQLVHEATRERNRVNKALTQANVTLGNVLSDLFGVSGQQMIEALLAGEATPDEIAELARGRARCKIPAIRASLEHHRLRDHHRFLIDHCLTHLEQIEASLVTLEEEISRRVQQHYGRPYELLQSLPGVGPDTAASLIAEVGVDMSRFPSEAQLASWVGVCPGNQESAGKRGSGATTKGNRWLRATLSQCAWAASKEKGSATEAQFRRLEARRGRLRSIVAVEHTLIRLLHRVLRTGEAYVGPVPKPLSEKRRQKRLRYHRRCVHRLEQAVTGETAPPGAPESLSPPASQRPAKRKQAAR